jgi:serine/threonine protein kinase
MSFVFPIADTLKKIDRAVEKKVYPATTDTIAAKGSIPKRFLPVVTQTVETISALYLQMKYMDVWGVPNEKKTPLEYARENAKRVVGSSRKSKASCLEKFREVRRVDKGAYGNVFTGYQKNVKYAIKQVSLDPALYQDIGPESIKRELEITEEMGRKGVGPKLFDAFVCKTMGRAHLYLVLEYFNRRSLWDFFEEGETVAEEEIKLLSDTIKKMHESGIVHSDLHAGNILVHENSDGSLKFAIGDFGMSHRAKEAVEIQQRNDLSGSFVSAMERVAVSVRPLVWKLIKDGDIVVDIDIPTGMKSSVFGTSFKNSRSKRVSTKT